MPSGHQAGPLNSTQVPRDPFPRASCGAFDQAARPVASGPPRATRLRLFASHCAHLVNEAEQRIAPSRASALRPWPLLALALSGCGPSETRPPYLDDSSTSGVTAEEGEDEFVVPMPRPPKTGECEPSEFELPLLRPNFYFVLDASESMTLRLPDTSNRDRFTAARLAITDMLRAVGDRVHFGAALFPSGEGNGCHAGGEVFPMRRGDPSNADGANGPGVAALAFTLAKRVPSGATPIRETLQILRPRLEALEGPVFVFLLTDGAPNCSQRPCSAAGCIPNLEQQWLTEDIACDSDFNCCAPELFPHLCLDDSATLEELRLFSERGIRTFVIGLPGSAPFAGVLDSMAVAAQTARDATPRYYPTTDTVDLALTLSDLAQKLTVDCTLTLERPTTRPVLVVADEATLAPGEDTWRWLAEGSQLQLVGSTCQAWKAGEISNIKLVQDCTVLIR